MTAPEPPAPTGPLMIAPFREVIHNIQQFGEHWSWRCGVQWTRASEGWKSGACRYDHVCGSWDELVQQGTAHLEKWHGIVPAAAAPDTGAALRAFADDVERRLPLLREEDPHSDWSRGVVWVLDRMRKAAGAAAAQPRKTRVTAIAYGPTPDTPRPFPGALFGVDRRWHDVPMGSVVCRCHGIDISPKLPSEPQPDTGQARETGADRAARSRRFAPEDALSVAERLGAAEASGDTGQAPDVTTSVLAAAVAWKARYDEMFDEPPASGTTMRPIYDALLGTTREGKR